MGPTTARRAAGDDGPTPGPTALADWIGDHADRTLATAERWMTQSLPVPAALIRQVWPDPYWRGALHHAVIAPYGGAGAGADGAEGPDVRRAGVLTGVPARPGGPLLVTGLDGERELDDALVVGPGGMIAKPSDDLAAAAARLGGEGDRRVRSDLCDDLCHRGTVCGDSSLALPYPPAVSAGRAPGASAKPSRRQASSSLRRTKHEPACSSMPFVALGAHGTFASAGDCVTSALDPLPRGGVRRFGPAPGDGMRRCGRRMEGC